MTMQKNARAVRSFAKLMKFATWLKALPNCLTPPPFRLMQISSAYWQSRALYVAARLNIAAVLGEDTLAAEAIADRAGAQPDAVRRLLRMLAAMGVFEEVAPGQFRNNTLSGPMREDHPQSVRAMIMMHNSEAMSRPWFEHLEDGVRSGTPPFELAHGAGFYDWMDAHPDFDTLFAHAMDCVEALLGDNFATDFAWERFDRVIDVGGSKGAKSIAILKRHPRLTALVVDRPRIIEAGERHWRERQAVDLLNRLHFQAGDLMTSIPRAVGPGDIYLLSAVLHGFNDDTGVAILDRLAEAVGGTDARVALMEMVLPEQGSDLPGASFDMQMFTVRGRERTLAEWQALVDRSGLELEEVVGLRSLASLIVLRHKR